MLEAPYFDWIIIGSGFGGSVSALRLVEKGYRVLLLEKGRRLAKEDFPKTNWELGRWMWRPELGLRGFFQMSFLRHLTVVHGIGVGGGSLVYANTLPMPKRSFFTARSWGHLADWEQELAPHYATARRMLGSAQNPRMTRGDAVLREIAKDLGREAHFAPTDVAVYFGEPGKTTPDPYFGGEGPPRTGCTFCGACMTGCRVGAKNTLDRNYLYLAERRGLKLHAETEVLAVRPAAQGGYRIECKGSFDGKRSDFLAGHVVFAGGVMGTMPLLLALKDDPKGLPELSDRLGQAVRTNSESLSAVVSSNLDDDFSKGVAITSILHTDDHSHLEPVRYAAGSGFFRLMSMPFAPGSNVVERFAGALGGMIKHPVAWAKAFFVPDFAKQAQILLYMRTLEETISFRLGRSLRSGGRRALISELDASGQAPQASMPEAVELARRFAAKVGGVPMTLLTEAVLGVPTTAHILGGASMGRDASEGVIDAQHRIHGYPELYVIDGSAISANPGVNPSLTITALAERAMALIPAAPPA